MSGFDEYLQVNSKPIDAIVGHALGFVSTHTEVTLVKEGMHGPFAKPSVPLFPTPILSDIKKESQEEQDELTKEDLTEFGALAEVQTQSLLASVHDSHAIGTGAREQLQYGKAYYRLAADNTGMIITNVGLIELSHYGHADAVEIIASDEENSKTLKIGRIAGNVIMIGYLVKAREEEEIMKLVDEYGAVPTDGAWIVSGVFEDEADLDLKIDVLRQRAQSMGRANDIEEVLAALRKRAIAAKESILYRKETGLSLPTTEDLSAFEHLLQEAGN